ncbi:MAG: 30S ribosomal protein S17e [Acidianus infernus]|nr:30S ribosomal protein S17e [Acidianus infernus]
MGNIYTRDIKRIAVEIYEKYKDEVTTDYSKNKEVVKKYIDVYSKKVRNRIAGYLTRYAKRMSSQKSVSEGEVVEESE